MLGLESWPSSHSQIVVPMASSSLASAVTLCIWSPRTLWTWPQTSEVWTNFNIPAREMESFSSHCQNVISGINISYLLYSNLPEEVNVLSDREESFADCSALTPGTSLLFVTHSNVTLLLTEISDTEETVTVSMPAFFWLTDFLCSDVFVFVIWSKHNQAS